MGPASGGGATSGTAERHLWFFMRVSGVVMLFLAVGHLVNMHLVTGVERIDHAWILRRWANPAWRLYDWLLLGFALAHGTNGLRAVLADYLPRGRFGLGVRWLLYTVALVVFVMGTQIVLTAPRP